MHTIQPSLCRLLIACAFGVALVLAPDARQIHASDGVVTDCSNDAQFSSLLIGGGTITFNCGAGPHTILISSQKSINAPTIIDGGGTITLDGQNAHRLFDVGAALTLRQIVLTQGYFNGDGGAIRITDTGTLSLESSTIRDSRATASGGAILSTGPLTITNSVLENNQALNGGALYPRFAGARTTIINSVLHDNHATDTTNGWGGAILVWDGAPITIEGSDIYTNSAQVGGGIYNYARSKLILTGNSRLRNNAVALHGGGLYNEGTAALSNVTLSGNTVAIGIGGGLANFSGGTVTLDDVTFSGNATSFRGGGLGNVGNATLTNVILSDNVASDGGGGLINFGIATLDNVTLSGNSATHGGGINNLSGGTATLTNVTLSGNTATSGSGGGLSNAGTATLDNVTLSSNTAYGGNGGGIDNLNGTMTLTNVTLSGNASTFGGGVNNFTSSTTGSTATLTNVTLSGNTASIGGGLYNASNSATNSTAILTNVTFSGNIAGSSGGGIANSNGTAMLINVTLSDNTAGLSGGGISQQNGGTVTVKNTIVANSPSGGNCAGSLTNNGFNLASDASCGFNQVPNVMLGPLANHGGPTLTHMPQPGSPAIDFVAVGCPPPATDQRGAKRPAGAACDAGAVEYGAAVAVVDLPLVMK